VRFPTLLRCFLPLLFVLFAIHAWASPEAAARYSDQAQDAFKDGDFARALDLLTRAIAEDDNNPELYANRGSCYDNLGRTEDALRDFDTSYRKRVSVKNDPNDKGLAEILYNRGAVLARARRFPEALADFEKAIRIDPDFPDARMDIAWMLATNPDPKFRQPEKAIEYAQEEIRRHGEHSPGVVDTLAAAYASAGKFEEAVLKEKVALDMASTPVQRKQYRERLRIYEGKRGYVDSGLE
jgi:tetratricopeptide (TPR) repeat protein